MTYNQAWLDELSKPENDALVLAGDVKGIFNKYVVTVGPLLWSDAPLDAFIGYVGNDWLIGLTGPQQTGFLTTHVTSEGLVTFSNPSTRSALAPPIISEEAAASLTAIYSTRERLFESLGLDNIGRDGIVEVLKEIPTSAQAIEIQKRDVLVSIQRKTGLLMNTSLANLITIESLIGS